MKVSISRPPNFDQIVSVFPSATKAGVLFTFGDTVYNPSGIKIPEHLMRHEEVHEEQQKQDGPELWWQKYLQDKLFRFEQELAAHRMEYRTYSLTNNRAFRMAYLHSCVERLSGSLYDHCCSMKIAKKLIKEL